MRARLVSWLVSFVVAGALVLSLAVPARDALRDDRGRSADMLDATGWRVRGHGRAAVFGALAGGAARSRALPGPDTPGGAAAGPLFRPPCRPVAVHPEQENGRRDHPPAVLFLATTATSCWRRRARRTSPRSRR